MLEVSVEVLARDGTTQPVYLLWLRPLGAFPQSTEADTDRLTMSG